MPEDFSSALAGISSCSEDEDISIHDGSHPRRGNGDRGDAGDLDDDQQARNVMREPPVHANAQELRQSLGLAQLAFFETRAKLLDLTKRYNTLVREAEAQRATKGGSKSKAPVSPLNQRVVETARKYCLLYHLWVPGLLFPVNAQPNVDPRDPSRWQSPESQTIAEQAELYSILPSELHKSVRTYPDFARVFTKAVTDERANIVKNVKDIAADLFASLEVKSTLFSGDKSLKVHEPKLLGLLKRPGDSQYTQLSPVLFADSTQLRGNELFKNPVLVQIARVLMFGKAIILSNKKRGGPKGRGERMGAQTVTEGLIACTATLARYLLSHDSEFSAKGDATGIQYQKDFEFYLKLLLLPEKRRWALDVIDYFNAGVFGSKLRPSIHSEDHSTGASTQARSWEDELLLQIGDNSDDQEEPLRPGTPSVAALSDSEPSWPYSATTSGNLDPLDFVPAVPQPEIVVGAVRPRPTLHKPDLPPSISHGNDVSMTAPKQAAQPARPVNVHRDTETIISTDSQALQLARGVSHLSIDPRRAQAVVPEPASSGQSDRRRVQKISTATSKSKGAAMTAYPVGAVGQTQVVDELGTITPAPLAQPPAGRTTRSRKKIQA